MKKNQLILLILAVPVGYWLVNKYVASKKPAVTPNTTPVDISYL